MLNKVTITGADNSTDPKKLVELSEKYPFVEWAILFSLKHTNVGTPRFPNWAWVNNFVIDVDDNIDYHNLFCSAHLCGNVVRTLVRDGVLNFPFLNLSFFDRVQINFHGKILDFNDKFINTISYLFNDNGIQTIIQMDKINDHILQKCLDKNLNVAPLFDTSHGAGILPNAWPKPISGIYNGFAGGLGPDNLAQEIEKILEVAGNEKVWIDMETKVRSNNDALFDLDKVEKCLEIASKYVEKD